MPTIRLIHWNAIEAAERGERIHRLGYQVSWDLPAGPDFLRLLRQEPPLAVVIDLSRLPSQGRDMGVLGAIGVVRPVEPPPSPRLPRLSR